MDLKLERKMLDVVAEIMNQQSQGRSQRSSMELEMLDVVAETMNQQSQGRNQRSSMELGYAGRCKDSDR